MLVRPVIEAKEEPQKTLADMDEWVVCVCRFFKDPIIRWRVDKRVYGPRSSRGLVEGTTSVPSDYRVLRVLGPLTFDMDAFGEVLDTDAHNREGDH